MLTLKLKQSILLLFILFAACIQQSCADRQKQDRSEKPDWNNEIIYHVMQRSFYDSSGDGHGDLNGVVQKLDYLEELGVTTILFLPLYESDFYHNYFPIDYERIDPRYGTMDDYLAFVKAVHDRGMKFIMDMETQYVQNGNHWFEDSYKNPGSPYSDFIYYSDDEQHYPEQFLRASGEELYTYRAWPDQELHIFHLDMNHQTVKDYMKDYYAFWVDPKGDGSLEGGVDGFRIDHIMDDLDYKGIFTNLYTDFWKPVFDHVKAINPNLFIVGEQSNWASYGDEMMEKSGADASFGFLVRYAIADAMMSDADDAPGATNIAQFIKNTLDHIPDDKFYVHFIENHDIPRWASEMKGHERKKRCGAILTLLLPGIPSIYYGQELGVTGKVYDWSYDVNHIPVREAFPWTPDPNDKGIAAFYKDTGPWWDVSYFNTGKAEAFALSKQKNDKNSLWHLYKDLIEFRKQTPALTHGDFNIIRPGDDRLFAFSRSKGEESVQVFMNLSEKPMSVDVMKLGDVRFIEDAVILEGGIHLDAYGFVVFAGGI
ncbi:MAG: alpha-amylase family glycosyl hydrolase [Bacteroidales bacterium]|nr:alpha-amylase family glycosyl hydrolase [Bacteroidales bacterium]